MKVMLQFRIELLNIDPPVWRRIQLPEDYSLWDLHVAIQDAIGWLDSHLHAFRVVGSPLVYGIPDKDGDDLFDTQPGWEVRTRDILTHASPIGMYEYDFGDSWIHLVVFEEFVGCEDQSPHPKCIDGKRRCPPEDCGGSHGYVEFLKAIDDSSHEEHESMLAWVGGPFDAEEFDAGSVEFDDPKQRWQMAIGGAEV